MKKEGKRKALAAVVCGAMLTVALVGGTFAYLTDRDSAANVFTVGDVAIELTEDFQNGAELLPGVNVDKDVKVANTGKTDAWVWVDIAIPAVLDEVNDASANVLHFNYSEKSVESGQWTWKNNAGSWNVREETIGDVLYNVYTVMYQTALEPGETTDTAAMYKVYLDANVDIDPEGNWYKVVNGTAVSLGINSEKLGNPIMYVSAYAIQKDGFENVQAAYAAYGTQWGDNGTEWATPATAVATADELSKALAAGESVYLTEDVTVTSTMNVAAGFDAKLSLNGHNLSYAVSNNGASAIINNKGNLEISGEGTICFVAENPDLNAIPAYATNTITNTGKLVIGEGVTVTNSSDGGASYAVDNHGEFILDGGTLIGDRCALRVAKYNQDNVKFVMNSGTVEAKTPAWIQLPGSDTNVAPNISVTINGGTFKSTKESSSADNDVLYTYSFGNSHANTSVTINGGEFLGGTVSIGSGYKGDAPKLTINGGTFDFDVLQWLADGTSKVLYAANNK